MISTSRPDLPDLLAYIKRVEEARKLVAEFDEWLASAPPLPSVEPPEATDGRNAADRVGDHRGPGHPRRRNPPP